MGFGFLFVGFMMMLEIGWEISGDPQIGLDILPDFIGYLLMLRSMRYLRKNSRDFNIFYHVVQILCIVGGVSLVTELSAVVMRLCSLHGLSVAANVLGICRYIENPLMIVAVLFLTGAIRELACSLGLVKLSRLALISSILSSAYYLMSSIVTVVSLGALVVAATALLFFVQLIMLLVTIYFCYCEIGFEGEENVPEKDPLLARIVASLVRAGKRRDRDD